MIWPGCVTEAGSGRLVYLGDDQSLFRLHRKTLPISQQVRLNDLSDWERDQIRCFHDDPVIGPITIDGLLHVAVDRLHTGYQHTSDGYVGPFAKIRATHGGCVISCRHVEAIARINRIVQTWPIRNRLLIVQGVIPSLILDIFEGRNHLVSTCYVDQALGHLFECMMLSFAGFEGEALIPILLRLAA